MTQPERALLGVVLGALCACVPGVDPAGKDGGPAPTDAGAIPAHGLLINEVRCRDGDFVELYNASSTALQLAGVVLTDRPDDSAHRYALPAGTTLQPGGLLAILRAGSGSQGFAFGLSCGRDTITLLSPANQVLDRVALPLMSRGNSYGRLPDGSEVFAETVPSPGVSNTAAPDPVRLLFTPPEVVDIDLQLSPQALEALAAEPRSYVAGTAAITTLDVATAQIGVGVRLKGGFGSFRGLDDKAGFKISFTYQDPERRFLGLKKITLNNMVQDASMLHEVVAYRVFAALGLPSPRTGYARVRVNDQAYGLYLLLEAFDDVFFSRFFAATSHVYEGAPGGDLDIEGEPFFEVDEGDSDDRADLGLLVAAMHEEGAAWDAAAATVLDLDAAQRLFATELYLGHWDGYAATVNNYYLHSDGDGRFTVIPYGADQTMGGAMSFHHGEGLVFKRCLDSAACRAGYDDKIALASTTVATLDLDTWISALAAGIEAEVEADPRRPYAMDDWRFGVQSLRTFLASQAIDVPLLVDCLEDPSADRDQDGWRCDQDCDEDEATIHDSALELCGDRVDQDCSGIPDDGEECPACQELDRDGAIYLACPGAVSFADAQARCAAFQATLVTLDDAGEEAWLRAEIDDFGLSEWWIGLSDSAVEGQFTWADGTPLGYSNWAEGEPSPSGDEQDCVALQIGWQWVNLWCEYGLAALCER